MRTIQLSFSLFTFWEDLVFLEAALLADEETKLLVGPVTKLLAEFPGALQADMETRRGLLQSFAHGAIADRNLDRGIRTLFSATLHLVGQDRKRTEFVTLFDTHIGNIVKYALRRQVDVAEGIFAKLSLGIYPDAFRTEHTMRLGVLINAAKTVLDDHKKAEVARVDSRLTVRGWKEDANAVRLSVHGQLTTLAAAKRYGKPWVESFFLKREDAAEEATDDSLTTESETSEIK
jgi:hypothetical protein